MKLIMLDVDGVIASVPNNATFAGDHMHLDFGAWHPECVQALNRLCRETNALVVISSTWRKLPYGQEHTKWWNEQFKLANAPSVHVWGITGQADNGFRGREVNAYLKHLPNSFIGMLQHDKIERYVILDDDSDFYEYQPFYHIDGRIGFTEQDADLLIEYFNNDRSIPKVTHYHPESRKINDDDFSLTWK